MSSNFDAIVVGAGPAGAICARKLALGGAKVLLIDKEKFPRDKPCGDFISARLCDRLMQMGLKIALSETPHCVIDDLLFSHPSVGSFLIEGTAKNRESYGFVCKRTTLDALFVEEAKKHVDFLDGVKIKGPIIENAQVVGVYSEQTQYRAKVVVGADGANGILAKTLRTNVLDENHHAVSIRTYYSQIKDLTPHVELHFIDQVQPGYFWIFPTDYATGEANVGLGILSSHVRNQNVQLKSLLHSITTEHPQFRDRFKNAQCNSSTKGWPLPFGSKKRPLAFAGAVLIGDAGGLIDPMTGEGIENAIRSAECAADTILQALQKEDFSKVFLQKYEKAVDRVIRPELRKGYFIQKISRHPFILKHVFLLLKHSRAARQVIANKFF